MGCVALLSLLNMQCNGVHELRFMIKALLMETVIVHRILERGRIQRANIVCVKKKGSAMLL